jgi:hypothetical protein
MMRQECIWNYMRNFWGEDHLEDGERDGRIVLQHILVKVIVRWLELA